jgi:SPP1 family predicted phage head-tail adaptor
MRERVTLLRKSVARDQLGGEVITWQQVREVWAHVDPLTGREFFAALQVNAESTLTFSLHYEDASEVTSEWRLLWNGVQYDILATARIDVRVQQLRCRTAPDRNG